MSATGRLSDSAEKLSAERRSAPSAACRLCRNQPVAMLKNSPTSATTAAASPAAVVLARRLASMAVVAKRRRSTPWVPPGARTAALTSMRSSSKRTSGTGSARHGSGASAGAPGSGQVANLLALAVEQLGAEQVRLHRQAGHRLARVLAIVELEVGRHQRRHHLGHPARPLLGRAERQLVHAPRQRDDQGGRDQAERHEQQRHEPDQASGRMRRSGWHLERRWRSPRRRPHRSIDQMGRTLRLAGTLRPPRSCSREVAGGSRRCVRAAPLFTRTG